MFENFAVDIGEFESATTCNIVLQDGSWWRDLCLRSNSDIRRGCSDRHSPFTPRIGVRRHYSHRWPECWGEIRLEMVYCRWYQLDLPADRSRSIPLPHIRQEDTDRHHPQGSDQIKSHLERNPPIPLKIQKRSPNHPGSDSSFFVGLFIKSKSSKITLFLNKMFLVLYLVWFYCHIFASGLGGVIMDWVMLLT